jgi:hypothetical protein
MIHYQLQCQGDHVFDGWFNDSASFDRQAEARLIACPLCSSVEIRRALMAPALARSKRTGRDHAPSEDTAPARAPAEPNGVAPAVSSAVGALALPDMPEKLRSVLQQLRSEVEKHCDYVGTDFAEEAAASIMAKRRFAASTERQHRQRPKRSRMKASSSALCPGCAGPTADRRMIILGAGRPG